MPTPQAKLYAGPYEIWNFQNGSAYVRNLYDLNNARYIVGLGEWEEAVTAPVFAPTPPFDVTATAIHFGDIGPYKFHPLLIEAGENATTESALLRFWFDPTIPETGGSNQVQARNTFRRNFPLDPRTVRPSHGTAAVRPWDDGAGALSSDIKTMMASGKHPVVVGVIDDGIPFALKSLRDDKGRPRMDYFWAQSAVLAGWPTPQPTAVPFGRELTGQDIADLIATHGRNEDAIYTAAGMVDPAGDLGLNIMRLATHGAHITDLAGGFDPFDADRDIAPLVRVVGVQLPRGSLEDTSGFGKDVFLLSAIKYIFARADRIAADLGLESVPVITNISLGITGGPHDGSHQLEAAIDEIAGVRESRKPDKRSRTVVLLPSGNSFEEETHACIDPEMWHEDTFVIPLNVQPEDRTSSFVEIWFPEDLTFDSEEGLLHFLDHAIGISRPGTGEAGLFEPQVPPLLLTVTRLIKIGGRIVGQLSADTYRETGRVRVMLALAPTHFVPSADTPADAGRCPAGTWLIALIADKYPKIKLAPVSCYVQRDEDPALRGNGGRQARIDGRAMLKLNPNAGNGKRPPVSGFGGINGWATRGYPLTAPPSPSKAHRFAVAGYVDRSLGFSPQPGDVVRQVYPARYSASHRVGQATVSGAHRTEATPLEFGIRGSGTRSGSSIHLSGTSTAVPAVIREAAVKIVNGTEHQARHVFTDNGGIELEQIDLPTPAHDDTSPEAERARERKERLNRLFLGQRRSSTSSR